MKALLVNGSPFKEGNTYLALNEVARTLQSEGIETEILQLGNKPVRGCIACGGCRKAGNGCCVFDDDFCNQLCRAAREADAFVFGSPVYYGQPNGARPAGSHPKGTLCCREILRIQAVCQCGRMPQGWSFCLFRHHEHGFPDDEHASSHQPLLEYCLWGSTGRNCPGCGGTADHAHDGA